MSPLSPPDFVLTVFVMSLIALFMTFVISVILSFLPPWRSK